MSGSLYLVFLYHQTTTHSSFFDQPPERPSGSRSSSPASDVEHQPQLHAQPSKTVRVQEHCRFSILRPPLSVKNMAKNWPNDVTSVVPVCVCSSCVLSRMCGPRTRLRDTRGGEIGVDLSGSCPRCELTHNLDSRLYSVH
jgi:hypothetical protein